jgi:hypothetical protein
MGTFLILGCSEASFVALDEIVVSRSSLSTSSSSRRSTLPPEVAGAISFYAIFLVISSISAFSQSSIISSSSTGVSSTFLTVATSFLTSATTFFSSLGSSFSPGS